MDEASLPKKPNIRIDAQPLSHWGAVALVWALVLNFYFAYLLFGTLPLMRPTWQTALWLAFMAGLLVFGLLWAPLHAGFHGLSFLDVLSTMIGRFPAKTILWIGFPACMLLWVLTEIQGLHRVGMDVLHRLGVVTSDSLFVPIAFLVLAILLGLLLWVASWDDWRGFGRSSIWLAKVAAVTWVGHTLSYLPSVAAGEIRASSSTSIDVGASLGYAFIWFGPFLLLLAKPLAEGQRTRTPARVSGSLWIWLAVGLIAMYVMGQHQYLGALGFQGKVLGLPIGGGPNQVGTIKSMMLLLTLLVATRLGLRLTAECWGIATRSAWHAILAACVTVLALSGLATWDLMRPYQLAASCVLGAGGLVNGCYWGRMLYLHSQHRPPWWSGAQKPAGGAQVWGITILALGIAMSLWTPLPSEGLLDTLATLREAEAGSIAAMIERVLLREMLAWGFDWSDSAHLADRPLIAWIYCFGGGLVLGFRTGRQEILTPSTPSNSSR